MALNTSSRDGVLLIEISDPRLLDEARIEQLEKEVLQAIDKSSEERIVIDFSKVEFMSSSMLGKLVRVHKKCKEFKVKLKFCSISKDILEVFKITRLDKVFDIESDADDAIKSFSKRGLFG